MPRQRNMRHLTLLLCATQVFGVNHDPTKFTGVWWVTCTAASTARLTAASRQPDACHCGGVSAAAVTTSSVHAQAIPLREEPHLSTWKPTPVHALAAGGCEPLLGHTL